MKLKITITVILLILVLVIGKSDAAVRELANDAYQPGDSVNYQQGFVSGEILASRFSVTPAEYPIDLMSIRILTGDGTPGGTTQGPFLIHLWEDTGGETPGEELIDPFIATLTAGYINEIDLTGHGLETIASGAVRVGLEFLQSPPPSFYSDADGFITQHANTIYESSFGWKYAEFFGLTGDWILRLVVNTTDPSPTITPTGMPPTYTPMPTYTPLPTYTARPTYTPPPTFTPLPTYTPLPTSTPYPTYTPPPASPTQYPGNDLTVMLWMPSNHYYPGQPFLVNALVENQGSSILNVQFLTILMMSGGNWFFPSWKTEFDSETRDFPTGETIISILPEFLWPAGVGTMDNIVFIAFITDVDYRDLLTAPDIRIWSFSE